MKPFRVHLRWEKYWLGLIIGGLVFENQLFSRQLPSTCCSFTIISNLWINCLFGHTIIDLYPRLPILVSIIFDIVTTNWLFINLQIAFMPFWGTQSFKVSPEFYSFRHWSDFPPKGSHKAPELNKLHEYIHVFSK